MTKRDDGDPAFPTGEDPRRGLSLRAYLAAHAPFTIEDAAMAFHQQNGRAPTLLVEDDRLEAMGVLAALRLDYADAMLAALEAGR